MADSKKKEPCPDFEFSVAPQSSGLWFVPPGQQQRAFISYKNTTETKISMVEWKNGNHFKMRELPKEEVIVALQKPFLLTLLMRDEGGWLVVEHKLHKGSVEITIDEETVYAAKVYGLMYRFVIPPKP